MRPGQRTTVGVDLSFMFRFLEDWGVSVSFWTFVPVLMHLTYPYSIICSYFSPEHVNSLPERIKVFAPSPVMLGVILTG